MGSGVHGAHVWNAAGVCADRPALASTYNTNTRLDAAQSAADAANSGVTTARNELGAFATAGTTLQAPMRLA